METQHVFKHGRQTNNEYIIKDLFPEDYKLIEHYPPPPSSENSLANAKRSKIEKYPWVE